MSDDHLVRAFILEGQARVVAAVGTVAFRAISERHHAVAGSQIALARTGMAAALLASFTTKESERVTLQVSGDGAPLEGLSADAWGDGRVRAYLRPRDFVLPATPGQRPTLARWVGRMGTVQVIRDLGMKERYQGQAAMVTGEIDEDVENYLRTSEQIPSALGCDAVLGDDGQLAAVGGLLIQPMPGGDVATVLRAVQHSLRTGMLYEALEAGVHRHEGATGLMRAVLEEHAASLQVLNTTPLRFACPCSRERVLAMLRLLGVDELQGMIADDGRAEVTCDFCSERYEISDVELVEVRRALVADAGGQSDS